MECKNLEEVRSNKVRERAEKYGADADMAESLYREMIARFVDMETAEFRSL